jgi:hypothetical protein
VTLETAADFHQVIVIARFKDAPTHDITAQSKLTLAAAKSQAIHRDMGDEVGGVVAESHGQLGCPADFLSRTCPKRCSFSMATIDPRSEI